MAAYFSDAELIDYELPLSVTCRYCGRSGYHWVKTDTGRRLATHAGRIHSCKAYLRVTHANS